MIAPAGLMDSLSRVGVSLVLHIKDREQPLYGDVATPLGPDGKFGFEVWGVLHVITIALSNVRSATSAEVGFAEYRSIRSRQRESFAAEHGRGQVLPATPRGGCDDC